MKQHMKINKTLNKPKHKDAKPLVCRLCLGRYMYYSRFCLLLLLSIFFNNIQANEYIKPDSLKWLSKDIQKALLEKQCVIPKVIHWEYSSTKIPVTGVLVGQFAAQGQYDIAVICSNEKNHFIRFFWGGSIMCKNELPSFGESIQITNEENMLEHALAYGGEKPKEIIHDPIEDIFLGKGSLVYYCSNGEWKKYAGAD